MCVAPMKFASLPDLAEVNPQANDGSNEQEAENHVQPVLHWSLLRRLTHWSANGNGFHFLVHRGESKSSQPLAVGSRRHQADRNKHDRTDHEHENCVMKKFMSISQRIAGD